jgi:hypothetical protein
VGLPLEEGIIDGVVEVWSMRGVWSVDERVLKAAGKGQGGEDRFIIIICLRLSTQAEPNNTMRMT